MADPLDEVAQQRLINEGKLPDSGNADLIPPLPTGIKLAPINQAGYVPVDGVEEGIGLEDQFNAPPPVIPIPAKNGADSE